MLIMAVAGDSGWENHRFIIEVDNSSGVGTTTSMAGAKEVLTPRPYERESQTPLHLGLSPPSVPGLPPLVDRSSTSAMRGRDRRC
jgi:hypothetical protein